MKTSLHFRSYIALLFLEWEIFETKVGEKIKTHVLCSIFLFRKSCVLWNNVEKYCGAGQTTDGNMAHANCMSDIYGHKHTLRICSTYCFSTARAVSWTRLTVTLYAPCLSCLLKVSQQFLGKGEFVYLSELSSSHRMVQIDKRVKCLLVFCNVCRSVQSKENFLCLICGSLIAQKFCNRGDTHWHDCWDVNRQALQFIVVCQALPYSITGRFLIWTQLFQWRSVRGTVAPACEWSRHTCWRGTKCHW